MSKFIVKVIRQNKGLIILILLMSVFRSSFADWNEVPTGSMKPTIVEGDRILVNKMAYDLRIPFTHSSVVKFSDPQRGDIVIFDSKVSGIRLVKRVIAVPGDVIQMRNNVIRINGKTLQYQTVSSNTLTSDKVENLLGLEHPVRVNNGAVSNSSNFGPLLIPQDYYLALGDNRDNSADSRVIGLVPRHEIVGRSKTVVMSLNYENYYFPRKERFFKSL